MGHVWAHKATSNSKSHCSATDRGLWAKGAKSTHGNQGESSKLSHWGSAGEERVCKRDTSQASVSQELSADSLLTTGICGRS